MSEMDIKVSVILPIYNMEKYLKQCLDSIRVQTLKEIEIICINDGSTDGSSIVINDFANRDSRFKVINQKNQGAALARNNGIVHAQGKYLSILDADDFFDPDMLLKAFVRAEETSADILLFRCNFYDDDTEIFTPCSWSIQKKYLKSDVFSNIDLSDYIFQFCVGWTWDKLFNREYIKSHNIEFQNTRIHNDALFVFTALLNANTIAVIQDILVSKRRAVHTSISSTSSVNLYWKDLFVFLDALKEYLITNNVIKLFEQSFYNLSLHQIIYLHDKVQGKNKKKMQKYIKKVVLNKYKFINFSPNYYYNKTEYNTMLLFYSTPVLSHVTRKAIVFYKQYGIVATVKKVINKMMSFLKI